MGRYSGPVTSVDQSSMFMPSFIARLPTSTSRRSYFALARSGYGGDHVETTIRDDIVGSRGDRSPAEDRVRRPELPGPCRGARRGIARASVALREVAEHPDRRRRPDSHPGDLEAG